MKTAEGIRDMFDREPVGRRSNAQVIADAWNADIEEMGRNAGYYKSTCAKYLATGTKARKQLRKLRKDLAHARKLCDYYSAEITAKESFEATLTDVIVQIARGAK